ncbi:MAG TPA: Crp/Fnr family transcriptional regulator [Parvularculaceae bacterium]|nr:Crp/Fnr family transcriptional regulator [Parvularculaceae bacterium]
MVGLTDSIKWELKRNPLLERLEEADFERLLAAAAPRVYKARGRLCTEGDPGGSLFMILSGRVKISKIGANGKDCILTFMGPGEVLGEMTLIDGSPRTASVEALETTRVLEVQRRDFLPVLERNPQTAIWIIEVLTKRLKETSEMVEAAAHQGAAPKLARALLRLASSHGKPDADGVRIDLPLSQSALGAHAGLLRESVNRQMKAWEEEELIRRHDGQIVLVQPDLLKIIAEDAD